MSTRLNKEFKRLRNDIYGDIIYGLVSRWDITSNSKYQIDIYFTKLDLRNYILNYNVNFTKNRLNDYLEGSNIGLPIELNKIIISYLPQYENIKLQFSLQYPEKYPFIGPIWKLQSSFTNTGLAINISDYYKYLLDVRNRAYGDKNIWSSAITMEKDIFQFSYHINHFEYLVE